MIFHLKSDFCLKILNSIRIRDDFSSQFKNPNEIRDDFYLKFLIGMGLELVNLISIDFHFYMQVTPVLT